MYNLKCINFASCTMTDEQVQYLAGCVTVNDTLEQLILRNCHLQPAGLLSIVSVLKNMRTLKYFDLSHNQITEEVMTLLAEVTSFNQIEHLDLSHCLQEVNSSVLLTAIANSVTLQHLDLSYI